MEDDQEAKYQSPSEKGHHDHNNINPWEDQRPLATEDTNSNSNSNSNTNQGDDDGLGGLCIKMKVTTGAARNNNERHPRVCNICSKGFSSGKALGGHMRMHAVSNNKQAHKAKEGTHISKPNNKNTSVLAGGNNPTCYLCRKSFPSMKSLFGHMRSHPERVWRGIQPPSFTTTPNDRASSNSTSSSTLSDDSAVDLSRALWGWSVTAKRGRKSLSCSNIDSGSKHGFEVEQRMQEAVYELMLLAHGDPKTVLECEDTSKMKKKLADGGDQVELSSVSRKIEEKSSNKMGYKEEDSNSDSDSDSQNFDGSTVGTDMKNKDKNSNNKKKGTKKMKLNEIGTAEQGNKLDNGTANRYRCSICNKSFPSHQALGGHLSIHKKSKNIQSMDELESDDVSAAEDKEEEAEHHAETATMHGDETEAVVEDGLGCSSTVEVMRGHQCNICNKTFSTGQALEGHKRSHWTSMAEDQSTQATFSLVEKGQNCPKILSFDLNQLPALDEEEGVQSGLFIPANIVASSHYASSSQNSATN